MLEESDLTPAEKALCEAAAAGRLLDRRARRLSEDDPAQGRAWSKDRQIRAQLLRQLLTGHGCLDQTFGPPLAVRLRGAQITGRLNLGGLTMRCPLELYDCFLGGRLDLAKTTAPDISLRGSYLGQRLSARRLHLYHNLNLSQGFQCHGPVKLPGAHIGGRLALDGARLTNRNGTALHAQQLTVNGSLFLRDAEVVGEVRLGGAYIGGQLICKGARLTNRNGTALHAQQLTVNGILFLRDAEVVGEIWLAGAHIGGQLNCEGARLTNRNGTALDAPQLTVDADLFLRDAEVVGEVRLVGAHIGGELSCKGARLTNRYGTALDAQQLTVDARLAMTGAEVVGEMWLVGARVGGQLDCEGARLTNPNGMALNAQQLTVDADLFLRDAEVVGEIWLAGAHIGGQLDCEGARLTNPEGRAVSAQRLTVDGAVIMRPAGLEGSITLTAARVGRWYDDKSTWPASLALEGFIYEAIDGPKVTPRGRLDWLLLHKQADGRTVYAPQPYEQLATVYRKAGDHEGARTVAIAKQQARLASVEGWARWPSRAWSAILRWTIGYGYKPALALPWLVGLFAVGWVVFDNAHPSYLRPAKSGLGQPGFNPARYTLDLLLPVANLKQRDAFVPHGYAAWWAFGLSLAGWLLAAIVVAGLTGIFKRD
jgi:hypothetical protein